MSSTLQTVQITGLGTEPAPLDYLVKDSQVIGLETVIATFDGSGVGSAFVPCVQIITDSGHILASCPAAAAAAGDVVEVTFAPFLKQPSGVEVTDGVTTVNPAREVDFTSGATVTELGPGVAGVAINPPTVTFGAVMGAGVVVADGTLASGFGVGSLRYVDPGVYHVTTNSQLSTGYGAVISPLNAYGLLPGIHQASYGGQVDPYTFQVNVTDYSGTLVNGSFSVIVFGIPLLAPQPTDAIGAAS
jgi:hypothetical protein